MLAGLESGKNTSGAQAEIRRQQGEIERRAKELEKAMGRMNEMLHAAAQRRESPPAPR